jgi:hypothetical protein
MTLEWISTNDAKCRNKGGSRKSSVFLIAVITVIIGDKD